MSLKDVQVAIRRVPPLFYALKFSRDAVRSTFGPRRLRRAVERKAQAGEPVRIIIGAGLQERDPAWIPTDVQYLNLLNDEHWRRGFGSNRIDSILAEHVWEHLTPADGKAGAAQCFKYLKPGGRLRLAIPDGNHPDPDYIEFVRPGGPGPGASDHKLLYTYDTLRDMLSSVGFQVNLLEYYDESGTFHHTDWDRTDGRIFRCRGWTEKKSDGSIMQYTSLIADAIRPAG